MAGLGTVEFVIRLSELRKAKKQLFFNRGDFQKTDCADLLVSSCAATFRAVGTEFEAPVTGNCPGALRMPLWLLRDLVLVAPSFKKPEVKLRFEPGTAQVETWKRTHADIVIGIFPNQKLDLPADAGVVDTLAMASLLSPEQVLDQGLRERVEAAQRCASGAISRAEEALRP
jgi:hypothetical protein